MLKDIKNFIESLGLSSSEIQVFLASIQVGLATVSQIAKKAGVNRASAYDIIRRLLLKGLLYEVSRGRIKKYEAVEPNMIFQKLHESKQRLDNEIKIFQELKPELNALYGIRFEQPAVSFYEEVPGVKNILLDTLEDSHTKEILSYASADYLKMGFGKEFLDKYWARRTELKIPTRGIIPETLEAKNIFTEEKNRRELRQIKFIPPEKCKFTNEIDIYADKVAIISLDAKNPYGVIIKSKSIADTQRSIYELLWNSF